MPTNLSKNKHALSLILNKTLKLITINGFDHTMKHRLKMVLMSLEAAASAYSLAL